MESRPAWGGAGRFIPSLEEGGHTSYDAIVAHVPMSLKRLPYGDLRIKSKSSDHKVKASADDIMLISSDPAAHQDDLLSLDFACLELGVEIQPDKCTSLHFTGKKMCSNFIIQLWNGQTKPL